MMNRLARARIISSCSSTTTTTTTSSSGGCRLNIINMSIIILDMGLLAWIE